MVFFGWFSPNSGDSANCSTPRDVSYGKTLQNIPKPSIFVGCVPLKRILEKIGSEFASRRWGVILNSVYGSSSVGVVSCKLFLVEFLRTR